MQEIQQTLKKLIVEVTELRNDIQQIKNEIAILKMKFNTTTNEQ